MSLIWARSTTSQELAWRRSIEVLDEQVDRPKTLALFPEDRCEGIGPDASIVRLKLSELRLRRPRQWGACWLALSLWEELQTRSVLGRALPASRKGTRWDQELFVLVAYRLLAPGSEWRLHREWFERTALADLLVADLDWPIFTSSIVVTIGCWSTKRRCSII